MQVNKCTEIQQCPICSGTSLDVIFTYNSPPEGEVSFAFSNDSSYYREYLQCHACNHLVSTYKMDLTSLYQGDYVASNYKDMDGIRSSFKRIISLDPNESDNILRTFRISNFLKKRYRDVYEGRTLLDVGSGLGVFPYAMKQAGWDCTALDPDHNAVSHLEKFVGVRAVQGDFLTVPDLDTFDVITFNKVLEHVENPIEMLKISRQYLKPGGFVYIELPDAEVAAYDGPDREEFFVDHLHVFSFLSVTILAQKSGLMPVLIERLREPSTKYTLYAFLVSASGNGNHGLGEVL
jgi:2-polyprenyl-3-methyl-5-hydroxy-6-metoxy-1,4-benzoquinol methylase